jgi:ATP-binding cassette subfamily F protein 3
MIQLQGAGKRFGHKLLFEGCDWLITQRERTGLVGGNGTGKSTLLKIIHGTESLDYGSLSYTKGTTLGYLPQDGLSLKGRSVFAECMSVFEDLRAMEQELETLHHKLAELDPAGEEYAAASDRAHHIDTEFRNRDGYAIEAQVGTVLNGLGFRKEDWPRFTEEFSGGWQMRIALAKLLLQKPNLLLLDEPTNHLDLEARNWLEGYLTNYPFGYILISHDRYFLDVTVQRTVEVWNKKVWFYSGNYEKYLTQKAERKSQLEAAYRNQRERIEQLEAFINRFRAQATKAKQVQSRIKELDKIERIEIPPEERVVNFEWPEPPRSGDDVVNISGLAKIYKTPEGKEKEVFKGANAIVKRLDRVAVVGVNGAGKSTLLKIITGSVEATAGKATVGPSVRMGYFSQNSMDVLDPKLTVFEELHKSNPHGTVGWVRNLAAAFKFTQDEVEKKISVLSGGEKSRVVLATILSAAPNFLVLDEPTNHLDIASREALLDALKKFPGTLMIVSHDRHFLRAITTRVFELDKHQLLVTDAHYDYYLSKKQKK